MQHDWTYHYHVSYGINQVSITCSNARWKSKKVLLQKPDGAICHWQTNSVTVPEIYMSCLALPRVIHTSALFKKDQGSNVCKHGIKLHTPNSATCAQKSSPNKRNTYPELLYMQHLVSDALMWIWDCLMWCQRQPNMQYSNHMECFFYMLLPPHFLASMHPCLVIQYLCFCNDWVVFQGRSW